MVSFIGSTAFIGVVDFIVSIDFVGVVDLMGLIDFFGLGFLVTIHEGLTVLHVLYLMSYIET